MYLSTVRSSFGNTYHVVYPGSSFTLNQVVSFVKSFGYQVNSVSFADWKLALQNSIRENRKNPLEPLISSFDSGLPLGGTFNCLVNQRISLFKD